MNREKLAWVVAIAVLAVLAFQLPGTFAARDDDYAFVRTLIDIHRQIVANYVRDIDDTELKEKAIEGMMGDLDPFSVWVPAAQQDEFDRMLEGTFKGVGIELNQLPDGQVQVVTPIEGSPAFAAGVMAGDIITKVNGEALDPAIRLPDVIKKIAGQAGTTVHLTVKHTSGQEVDLSMERREIVVPTIKGYQRKPDDTWDFYTLDDPKIAYIRITQFTPDSYRDLHDALVGTAGKPGIIDQGMKGLILDLRFNPGGLLDQAVKIINMFVHDKQRIVSTKGRNKPEQVFYADATDKLPDFPMIVLVNEHSASAAEIVSGSLMDNHRALVMGVRSYGKGSVQTLIPLDDNNGELKLTVAYYYLPSGRLVHRTKDAKDWGVDPQIVVPMDETQERVLLEQHVTQETVRKPMAKPQTQASSTQPADADATTQPVDLQLQQAVNTLVGLIVLQSSHAAPGAAVPAGETPAVPMTAPPASQAN
jgi:carboxyl-terminal processing protease